MRSACCLKRLRCSAAEAVEGLQQSGARGAGAGRVLYYPAKGTKERVWGMHTTVASHSKNSERSDAHAPKGVGRSAKCAAGAAASV